MWPFTRRRSRKGAGGVQAAAHTGPVAAAPAARTAPTAPPERVGPAGLPPLQRSVQPLAPAGLTAGLTTFSGDLAAWRSPARTHGPLGHDVHADAPSGIVDGIARPGVSHPRADVGPLPVAQRTAAGSPRSPRSPAPVIQPTATFAPSAPVAASASEDAPLVSPPGPTGAAAPVEPADAGTAAVGGASGAPAAARPESPPRRLAAVPSPPAVQRSVVTARPPADLPVLHLPALPAEAAPSGAQVEPPVQALPADAGSAPAVPDAPDLAHEGQQTVPRASGRPEQAGPADEAHRADGEHGTHSGEHPGAADLLGPLEPVSRPADSPPVQRTTGPSGPLPLAGTGDAKPKQRLGLGPPLSQGPAAPGGGPPPGSPLAASTEAAQAFLQSMGTPPADSGEQGAGAAPGTQSPPPSTPGAEVQRAPTKEPPPAGGDAPLVGERTIGDPAIGQAPIGGSATDGPAGRSPGGTDLPQLPVQRGAEARPPAPGSPAATARGEAGGTDAGGAPVVQRRSLPASQPPTSQPPAAQPPASQPPASQPPAAPPTDAPTPPASPSPAASQPPTTVPPSSADPAADTGEVPLLGARDPLVTGEGSLGADDGVGSTAADLAGEVGSAPDLPVASSGAAHGPASDLGLAAPGLDSLAAEATAHEALAPEAAAHEAVQRAPLIGDGPALTDQDASEPAPGLQLPAGPDLPLGAPAGAAPPTAPLALQRSAHGSTSPGAGPAPGTDSGGPLPAPRIVAPLLGAPAVQRAGREGLTVAQPAPGRPGAPGGASPPASLPQRAPQTLHVAIDPAHTATGPRAVPLQRSPARDAWSPTPASGPWGSAAPEPTPSTAPRPWDPAPGGGHPLAATVQRLATGDAPSGPPGGATAPPLPFAAQAGPAQGSAAGGERTAPSGLMVQRALQTTTSTTPTTPTPTTTAVGNPLALLQRRKDGHTSNGHAANGYAANGHAGNGHAANGHTGNGQVGDGQVWTTQAFGSTADAGGDVAVQRAEIGTVTSDVAAPAGDESTAAPAPQAASATGESPGSGIDDLDLDELTRRLGERLIHRIKRELRLERDRAGRLGDIRR